MRKLGVCQESHTVTHTLVLICTYIHLLNAYQSLLVAYEVTHIESGKYITRF